METLHIRVFSCRWQTADIQPFISDRSITTYRCAQCNYFRLAAAILVADCFRLKKMASADLNPPKNQLGHARNHSGKLLPVCYHHRGSCLESVEQTRRRVSKFAYVLWIRPVERGGTYFSNPVVDRTIFRTVDHAYGTTNYVISILNRLN